MVTHSKTPPSDRPERRIKIRKGKQDYPRERFYERVDTSGGPEACWPWMAGRTTAGYGSFTRSYRHVLAHREAYEIENGPIPPGAHVLHECDNPPCCNARHLFLGDQASNVADAKQKRRLAVGERHSQSLYSDEIVRKAIAVYRESGRSARQVAIEFGFGSQYLQKVLRGVVRSELLRSPEEPN